MNIYAKPGTLVQFMEEHVSLPQIYYGNNYNPIGLLNLGAVYTVKYTEVHSSHTRVYLEEFPGKPFNSVWFEDIT